MRKYVIMGVQGSGKGTQAMMLRTDLDLVHISVGDIFRWHVQTHTKLGAQVRRIMNAGELVDDDLVESVVRDRLAQHDHLLAGPIVHAAIERSAEPRELRPTSDERRVEPPRKRRHTR